MSAKTVLKAYAIAPLAPAVPLIVIGVAGRGDLENSFLLALIALSFSYIGGAFLLPLYWLYERLGWRGWRFYVPTAAVGGIVMAVWMANPRQAAPRALYLLCVGCAAACGGLFSFLVGPLSPLHQGDASTELNLRVPPKGI